MNIVAKIENSVGRDESGDPINEVLFSVNQHEENNNNFSLWIGLPKMKKDDGSYDWDSQDCLDVCLHGFWSNHLQKDIKSWLKYVNRMNEGGLDYWKDELDNVQKNLEEAIYVKKKIMEVL